jgi:hypothetical protein
MFLFNRIYTPKFINTADDLFNLRSELMCSIFEEFCDFLEVFVFWNNRRGPIGAGC